MRILNARPENSGVYICLASNDAGSDQAATIVEIERKFHQNSNFFKHNLKLFHFTILLLKQRIKKRVKIVSQINSNPKFHIRFINENLLNFLRS